MSEFLKEHGHSLSLGKIFIITILVVIWVLALLGLILYFPNNSSITPALWLHGSATLLLLFLLKRFGSQVKHALLITTPKLSWLLIAVIIGCLYWLFDYWTMAVVFELDAKAAVASWQAANSHYHIFTVFISTVILAPIFEELFFRGLLFHHLSKHIHIGLAAVFSALLFAAIHWSWPEFISLFTASLIYAYLLHRCGSLMTPLLAHMTHNFITFLYYFY